MMFQMSKHIGLCDSSSVPTPQPPWSPICIVFPFLESLHKGSNSTYALMDWHFFFLGFFFRLILVEQAQKSVPIVADWIYPGRCCVLSANWLFNRPVVCFWFFSVTAQAACLFTHVFLGSCVLIVLKEFMGVITLRNCDIYRKINPPGQGGGRGELQTLSAGLLLFLSVYFMGVWWVNVSQLLHLPWAEVPLLAWKWYKNQLENMLRFPFVN